MKSIKSIGRVALTAIIPSLALSACTENDEPGNDPENGNGSPKFVFATTVKGSNSTSYVLLTGESLDNGTLSPVRNGLVNDGATQWVFYKNYLYALTYNQGNAGSTRSYILGDNGQMIARDSEYHISRFSSYGAYNDDIITMSTGDGPDALADSHGYRPKTLLLTYLNVYAETTRTNNTSTGEYSMENFLKNGEYVTLAGAEQSGSRLYCGVVPMGLSQYGVADVDNNWVLPEFAHLVHDTAGGTGAGSYNANELVGTQYPNDCWVAIYDNADMLSPTIAHTNRISSPCGRYRSQYYQTVWAAENGDIYVFSPSYSKTMTDPVQRTEHPAGVCRIKAGTTEFDDYYCDIEEQTPGGNRSFMRCWPAGGDCFLMVMYDRSLTEANPVANELAIFDASAKKLTYVTGLPDNVASVGKTVYSMGGKVYIPVNVDNEYPAIYSIDTATAQATKGVTIEANDITGFGYMTPAI